MKLKKHNSEKQSFRELFEYMHNSLDFEELEKGNNMEVYLKGMEWYNKYVTTARYSLLSEQDLKCLMAVHSGPKTAEEIRNITGYSLDSIRPRMYKLYSRGLITQYREDTNKRKKHLFYKIAPLGIDEALNYIYEQND